MLQVQQLAGHSIATPWHQAGGSGAPCRGHRGMRHSAVVRHAAGMRGDGVCWSAYVLMVPWKERCIAWSAS
jgi:hypothetical protein